MPDPYDELLAEETGLGWLTAVVLPREKEPVPEPVLARLPAEERAHAATLQGRRAVEFVGGRLALRAAATRAGLPLPPVLSGPRREPLLPPGFAGSISHKRTLAVALAGPASEGSLGVDLEELLPARSGIARMVLRDEELAEVEALQEPERWEAIVRRFALKEAIYKALHPHCGRFVSYSEAAVSLGPEPAVTLHLAQGEGPFAVEARLWERAGLLVAGVRLVPAR